MQNDFCCCSDMVAMVTINLFKFHSFLALLPNFLLAKQKLFWKEYKNYVEDRQGVSEGCAEFGTSI